ncbi:MAG: hypothetical protein VB036_10295, partial [Propionicimonas sp.]|nr:hypothetical protein [Propionicimonas sp.]
MNHTIPSLYQPATGWFGDVMPSFANGEFHLFYTYLDRSDTGDPETFKGLDWAHLSTTDFLTFREHATAIGRGSKDAADLLVGAGSVLDTGDGFVAYDCGINPRRLSVGEPEQVVLRAISDDLHTWRKDETFEFRSDPQWYERDAWRDPFVYRDGDGWRMLLCARSNTGPVDRRGVVGLARSDDLDTWTATAPFLQMGTTYAPECIETFTQDGREYLVYSSYSDRFQTRYRMKSETGHFERATQDAL